jgi:hypothetical protein
MYDPHFCDMGLADRCIMSRDLDYYFSYSELFEKTLQASEGWRSDVNGKRTNK